MEIIQIYGTWYIGIVLIALSLSTKFACAQGEITRRGKTQIAIGSLIWPIMVVLMAGTFLVHLLSMIFAGRAAPKPQKVAPAATGDLDPTNLLIMLGVTNTRDGEAELLSLYSELEKSLSTLRTYAQGVTEIRHGQLALMTIEAINRARLQKMEQKKEAAR